MLLHAAFLDDTSDRQLMSQNIDTVENDGVSSGACKRPKLSPSCHLNTKTLVDSTSDMATSASAPLSDSADCCVCGTVVPLPNLEAGSVAGVL